MDSETSSPSPNIVKCKRVNYLEWQEYFMSIAFLSAQRSKDPRTQVGACIVNQDNKVVGIGYNGMPIGCHDDNMPWNKAEDDSQDKWLESKSPYVLLYWTTQTNFNVTFITVCHAELNAILNKNLADIKGCIIYVALFPCNMCAQIIIQSGIKEVVYYSDKYHNEAKFKASRYLLKTAGVHYRQFRPRQKKIIIDFESIEDTPVDNSNISINTTCDNKEEFTTNNNNTGMKRTFFIEDQAEQQQLQNLAHVQQVVQFVPLPTSHHNQKETLELKFAIVSLLLIACVTFFGWYMSDPKLIR